VLSRDVVSSPSDPRYRQPMSLDTEARLNVISAAHLYTMPDFHLRLTFTNRAGQHWACCLCPGDAQPLHATTWHNGQPMITSTKVLDATLESGSSTRSR